MKPIRISQPHDQTVIARALRHYVDSGQCAAELLTSPEHAETLAAIFELTP